MLMKKGKGYRKICEYTVVKEAKVESGLQFQDDNILFNLDIEECINNSKNKGMRSVKNEIKHNSF